MAYNATRTAIRNMAMKRPATAFISYSHRDEVALQSLITHLAMLRREGSIAEWFDQKILAGGEIDQEVSRQLDKCDLFLPLLTPDFLASNYCYETEMQRAIERHESGEMHIVPLVIEPCDWKASPLKRFKALPRDGKPVAEWTNKNNAYLDIVTELRRLICEDSATSGGAEAIVHVRPGEPLSTISRKAGFRRD
jgi:TIR domain